MFLGECLAAFIFLSIATYTDAVAPYCAAKKGIKKKMIIPNWLNGAALLVGIALHIGRWPELGNGVLIGAVAGIAFYMFGVFGAGDAKMSIALGSIVGEEFLFTVFLVALLVAVIWTFSTRLVKWGWRHTIEQEKQGLLYMWLKIRLQKPEIERFDVTRAPFAPFVLIGFLIVSWGEWFHV